MSEIHTIEAAYHPKNKMGFLIDWLLTLKCNYDCTYCPVGPLGHDNSVPHPPVDKCMTMLRQMYGYTDAVMKHKKPPFKDAILNVYGGEALYHPDICDILIGSSREYEKYAGSWRLRRRLTTNATASAKIWHTVCEHIEGVTFSYHSQGPKKLKVFFMNNIEHVVKQKIEYDIVVCMYPHEQHWKDCMQFLEYCQRNNLNARPKLLDGPQGVYTESHLQQLMPFMKKFDDEDIKKINKTERIQDQSRGCCGGRPMCMNRDIKNYVSMIPRNLGFKGWHCSANQFFLSGNNISGEYHTNKDCRVKLDGTLGPIATIDTMDDYIEDMRTKVELPRLMCVQDKCRCGTCAPKSKSMANLDKILDIYNQSSR
jgi:hypothetical protein